MVHINGNFGVSTDNASNLNFQREHFAFKLGYCRVDGGGLGSVVTANFVEGDNPLLVNIVNFLRKRPVDITLDSTSVQ